MVGSHSGGYSGEGEAEGCQNKVHVYIRIRTQVRAKARQKYQESRARGEGNRGKEAEGDDAGPRTGRLPGSREGWRGYPVSGLGGGSGSGSGGGPSRLLARALAALRGLAVERAVQEVAAGPGGRAARDCGDARAERRGVRPAAAHAEREHAVEDWRRGGTCVRGSVVRRSGQFKGRIWRRHLRGGAEGWGYVMSDICEMHDL